MVRSLIDRRSVLFLAAAVIAGPAESRAQDVDQVGAAIRKLYATLLTVMKGGASVPFAQRYATLEGPVEQALDLPTILRVAVGPTWSSAPAAQQAAMLAAFQKYTIATYVSQFQSYSGERLEVLPGLRPLGNGDQVLRSQIVEGSGTVHAIDYVMRSAAGAWKATDVLLDGSISRVAVLRSDFRRLLSQGGPPQLTSFLQQKATDLGAAR